jgi:hypothetical protein
MGRKTDRKRNRQVGRQTSSAQACWNADMTQERRHVGQAGTQVDRHAGKLTGRETDRQTDKQTDRQTNRQTNR